jgi:hypothetical protein
VRFPDIFRKFAQQSKNIDKNEKDSNCEFVIAHHGDEWDGTK